MGILEVGLFGGVRVTHDNWLTQVSMTREIQAFLAYLLLQRHRVHSREVLADLFWGERGQERARGSLNTALWKLKKALEPKGIPVGTYLHNHHQGGVAFNRESRYWLDIEVFENQVAGVLSRPFQTLDETQLLHLEQTLGLYQGDLLEGFYKEWALRERERLRGLYVRSLIYLLQYYGFHRAYERALAYGQQILDLDPLREEIHREMMRLYSQNGQRSQALRQYEICRATLANELGISAMEDTQTLYAQILRGTDRVGTPASPANQVGLNQAFQQLRVASQTIELAREQIQQALDYITQCSENNE